MTSRQMTIPRLWLMTDERIENRLWEAIQRLPIGAAGVVFRHYATEPGPRRALAQQVADHCKERAIALAIARDAMLARAVGAAFVHNPESATAGLPLSRAVHSLEDALAARDEGAALIFVSPVFLTRSHPGHAPLGIDKALAIARVGGAPAIALGGLNAERFARLQGAFHGWAGIDAWLKS